MGVIIIGTELPPVVIEEIVCEIKDKPPEPIEPPLFIERNRTHPKRFTKRQS